MKFIYLLKVCVKSCNKRHLLIPTYSTTLWLISNASVIDWVPLDEPLTHRLQTVAVSSWMHFVLFGHIFCTFLFIKLLYSTFWWVALLYGAWWITDIEIYQKEGRRFEWFRSLSIWRYYCDYFPIKVRKTADLDPSKNYLFAFYPHGVIGVSAVGAFASNGTDFEQLFPGITTFLTSLRGHFYAPFFREIVLAMGGRGTSQESLMHILDKKKYSGNGVVVVVGGAAEALVAHPGEYKIVLKSRKGFVRVAMKAGAHLVPVFSFGENDLFYPLQNPKNSFLRKFQEKCRQMTGVSPVLPLGRGILQKSFGFAPLRRPINVVIGAPIEIEGNPNPTQEEVDAVHAVFTKKLMELFESEKSKYLENHENVNLVIT